MAKYGRERDRVLKGLTEFQTYNLMAEAQINSLLDESEL